MCVVTSMASTFLRFVFVDSPRAETGEGSRAESRETPRRAPVRSNFVWGTSLGYLACAGSRVCISACAMRVCGASYVFSDINQSLFLEL